MRGCCACPGCGCTRPGLHTSGAAQALWSGGHPRVASLHAACVWQLLRGPVRVAVPGLWLMALGHVGCKSPGQLHAGWLWMCARTGQCLSPAPRPCSKHPRPPPLTLEPLAAPSSSLRAPNPSQTTDTQAHTQPFAAQDA